MSSSSFEPTIQRLTRRLLAIGSMSGIAWGACGALILLLVGIWTDLIWELSPTSRVGAIMLSMGGGVLLLGGFLYVAARATRRSTMIQRLDESAQTGGEIVSGFELQSAGSQTPGLSKGLADMAIAKAAQVASQISPTVVIPAKPVRRAVIAVVCSVVTFLIVGLLAPRLARTEWHRFADPFGDHPPYSYTQIQVEPGDIQVRYGDGMDVIATVTGSPVDELQLVIRTTGEDGKAHEEKLPMFADSTGQWRASISSMTQSGQYVVQARSARSYRFNIQIVTVPELKSVRFRIVPPAYTRSPIFEGPLPQGGISGLAGAQIEVRATSNRPLKSGTIELSTGQRTQSIAMQPATTDGTSHEVLGQWTIDAAGSFHLTVTDTAGQPSRESFSGTITLLQDQIPVVRIVEPPAQSLATPSVTVPVMISAEDDYGVTKLQLYRSLNDSRALPMTIEVPAPAARRFDQSVQLPLSAYGLQPGDVIKLFARVEDNDPAGAKGSESTVSVIQIISDEELEQMVRAREGLDMLVSKYQEAQRRLEAAQEEVEQLVKKLEKRDADGALSDEEREELKKLEDRLHEEAKALEESAKHVMPYDLDKSLNDELEKLTDKMQDAADAVAELAESKPNAGQAAKKLKELGEQLDQEKKAMKEGVNNPLEKLAEIFPLLEDENKFVELYYRQRDLAERLNSLKDQENPNDPAIKTRMRELEAEQRKNREDLDELLNDIETHAQRLPEDDERLQQLAKSSLEFVADLRASGALDAMSDAELGLGEFSGGRGYAKSKEAADIMEKFLSRCESNGMEAEGACEGLKFSPGEGALGDTLSQLLNDAGFKPGRGKGNGNSPGRGRGQGAGGGYSARRGAMNKMGLYGNLPTKGNPTAAKGGGKRQATAGGKGGTFSTGPNQITNSRIDPHGLLRSSGSSETAIPARYRGRVQEYFQRIADEADGKK